MNNYQEAVYYKIYQVFCSSTSWVVFFVVAFAFLTLHFCWYGEDKDKIVSEKTSKGLLLSALVGFFLKLAFWVFVPSPTMLNIEDPEVVKYCSSEFNVVERCK